ncbi:MAG TPA: VTT domain-containing protein [Myxococcota bacterium]|nr:VTT domain-containing protein [Myxococcota bacterium]
MSTWAPSIRRWLRPLLLVLFVAGLFWLHHHFGLRASISLDALRTRVAAHGPRGVLVFVATCVLCMLLHLPEILVIAAGGVLFGPLRGFLYGWTATLVGASLTFCLARYFLRDALQSSFLLRYERLRALDEHAARNGFRTVFVARVFLPLLPTLNWVFGPTRMRFLDYVGGTALGTIPGVAVITYFAHSISGIESMWDLVSFHNLVPALLIVSGPICAAIAGRRFVRAAGDGRALEDPNPRCEAAGGSASPTGLAPRAPQAHGGEHGPPGVA